MNKLPFLIPVLLLLVFVSCNNEDALFSNPTAEQTGLYFSNNLTETDDLNILDYLYFYNGGGVAIGDVNNDSLVDIFVSGNQVKNKLYINKGNLEFDDVSEQAGVEGSSSWNTGAVMGDVNGDGLLDIYVCAVVGINGFDGFNELYINNGDGTFDERAAEFGLDFDTYSSSAAFLDYDLDGDLDMYLLNHAVHTQSSYGKANLRNKRNYQTGDKLLQNNNGKFKDVSEQVGIYGGTNGYGLGIAISDFNKDGYPDIYVGNDFHEDDYYYLNNGDGTFKECLKEYFSHTSRFSMGNDVADINHDGWPDLMSLDMLPEDEKVLKSSEGASGVQVQKLQVDRFGYHYQFPRNMLYINQHNTPYLETAHLSGVAATDWSWSTLFGDYNQDGEQDIFISNGIPKRPNNLDYINFVSSDEIKNKINNTKLVDQKAIDMMPAGEMHNYLYKGMKDLTFKDMSKEWITKDKTITGATAWGDLDNDGDLDLVTNNLNSPIKLYINTTNSTHNYLKLKLKYTNKNSYGIGAKIYSYHKGQLQYKENYTVRGFQASSEPIIHFGYGKLKVVDSLKIIWPDNTYQVLTNINTNQTLSISPTNTKPYNFTTPIVESNPIFSKVEGNLGIDFTHEEDNYIDFNRQKLIPYQVSDRGPATSIGDLSQDGKDDIFFGGSKYNPSKIFIQVDSSYVKYDISTIAKDSIKEDVSAIISDFNNDKKNDLIIGTGGADYFNKMAPLLDTYYTQKDSIFSNAPFIEDFENTSILKANDFDNDGDLDLFVGNQSVSNDFGRLPTSYVLENIKGVFHIKQNIALKNIGLVTDAIWDDFDNDGTKDLIIVGEWMSPVFLKNTKGVFTRVNNSSNNINGLWQSIISFDMDGDGDNDYLLGNWGTNSKFVATEKYPMKMFYGDFDGNGQTETITTTAKNGKYYPLEGLNELGSQLTSLRKKYNTYQSFAGKTIEEILKDYTYSKDQIKHVHTLQSGYLKNEDGHFNFIPFTNSLQISPITSFLKFDFDSDGLEEVLVAGNYFGIKPFMGRLDSFSGAIIKNEEDIITGPKLGLKMAQKASRHLSIITLNKQTYLLVTYNNEKAEVYSFNKKNKE